MKFTQEQVDRRATARGVTPEYLREWLHYDHSTGFLTWKKVPTARYKVGEVAGYKTKDGDLRFQLRGAIFQCHRLAWLYVHGSWPNGLIDHINGDRSDNRMANLREATVSENAQNQRKAHRDNQSGFLGVRRGYKGSYRAAIKVNGVQRFLGTFKTPEEAHAAYVTEKRLVHPFGTL